MDVPTPFKRFRATRRPKEATPPGFAVASAPSGCHSAASSLASAVAYASKTTAVCPAPSSLPRTYRLRHEELGRAFDLVIANFSQVRCTSGSCEMMTCSAPFSLPAVEESAPGPWGGTELKGCPAQSYQKRYCFFPKAVVQSSTAEQSKRLHVSPISQTLLGDISDLPPRCTRTP